MRGKMIVGEKGLIKILYRDWGWLYSKEQLKEKIEYDGANSIDKSVTYLGFGKWQIAK